ncbi:heat shock 70 kDa protein 15-like [Vicia villosa]|uniref:heat shock 70 kDa protein 15-like n=1 Tax=Vicia villosa TaxID=3911 RepID=UPI00273BA038|nr:heat shock 70 kDa protein 15-like [Vicia villosa]
MTLKEYEMALQDRVMEETKDRKNAVEAYVYDRRNKLNDKYQDFVIASEREGFTSKLQEVEDWLYEEGEDETKGVYVAKLEELKKQGDPIEERYKEYTERGTIVDQFIYCITSYREAAMSPDPKFDHIDISEKQKVLNECVDAENWLREKKQHQDSLPKHANPVLLSAAIRKKAEAVDRFCKPIMTKPKPAKPATPPAPPSPASSGSEQQQPQADANANSTNENAGDGSQASSASSEPMETGYIKFGRHHTFKQWDPGVILEP